MIALPPTILSALSERETSTYDWWLATMHHRTHKGVPLDFTQHAYLPGILQDKSPDIRVKKSTQCGVSEIEINHAMALTDQGRAVFWVFPDERIRNVFVKERIDPTIGASRYYRGMAEAARNRTRKQVATDEVALKQLGSTAIALVGSNSEAGFKSFPADDIIIDEIDLCDQANIMLAQDRVAHSPHRTQWRVGNPSTSGYGIDALYKASDRKAWKIPCPHCGAKQSIGWFTHVVREISEGQYESRSPVLSVLCAKCERDMDRLAPGEWVAEYPDRDSSGYHISQLFSGSVSLAEMWDAFQRGLSNQTELMRFYNSVLGLAYEPAGAKLSPAILNRCVDEYGMASTGRNCYGGADVGKEIHVVIRHESSRVIYAGTVREFEQLDNLIDAFPGTWVIDALPETRKAREFAARHRGSVYLCTFVTTDTVKGFRVEPEEMTVKAHRTQSLDDSHGSWLRGESRLFRSAASVPDFYDQMCAPTRVFERRGETDSGRFVWREGDQADHYRHADNYSYLAMQIRNAVGVPVLEFV